MLRDFDRKPPLWLERDAELYGRDLTPSEFLAEELEDRPSLRLLQGGRSSSSRCHVNSPGVDRSCRAQHRTAPAPTNPSCPGGGPDLPSVAVELLGALRQAHRMYLDALGAHIVTLERVAEVTGTNLTVELVALREQRAVAELHCQAMQAIYAEQAR